MPESFEIYVVYKRHSAFLSLRAADSRRLNAADPKVAGAQPLDNATD